MPAARSISRLRCGSHQTWYASTAMPRPVAQLVAEIVGVLHRVHARAVGRVHRMQRLDRERHARGARVARSSPMPSRTISRAPARSFDSIVPSRFFGSPPTTSTRHRAPSASASSTARRLSSCAARRPSRSERREHPAAAIAGDRESGIPDAPRRVLQAGGRHLVSPGRDAADAVAGASGDGLGQRPLPPHRRGVECKEVGVGFGHGVGFRSSPRAIASARVVVWYLAIMPGTSQSGSAPFSTQARNSPATCAKWASCPT